MATRDMNDVPPEYISGKSRDGLPWCSTMWGAREMQGFCRRLIESRLPAGWSLEVIVYRSGIVPVREVKAVVRNPQNQPTTYYIPVPRAESPWAPPVGRVLVAFFEAEFAGVQ